MTNKRARIINGIATFYLILGLLFGLLVGGSTIILGTSFIRLGSQMTVNEGFGIFTGFLLMLVIWIVTFIQVAFIRGFAELIEQTSLSRARLEQLTLEQNRYHTTATPSIPQPFDPNR